jgi:hypothetical protein
VQNQQVLHAGCEMPDVGAKRKTWLRNELHMLRPQGASAKLAKPREPRGFAFQPMLLARTTQRICRPNCLSAIQKSKRIGILVAWSAIEPLVAEMVVGNRIEGHIEGVRHVTFNGYDLHRSLLADSVIHRLVEIPRALAHAST